MRLKALFFFLLVGLCSYGQNCTVIGFPIDGSNSVPVDVTITWPAVNGINGYLLSLGTSLGGNDILDKQSVGIDNFYKAPLGLPENTLIYATLSILLFNTQPQTPQMERAFRQ